MRFTITTTALLAVVPCSSAAPIDKRQQGGNFLQGITSLFGNLGSHTPGNGANYAKNNGGTGGLMADLQVPMDHIKYTMSPSSAEQPIPAPQNSQMREGHRLAHVAIYKGLGGGNAKGESGDSDE